MPIRLLLSLHYLAAALPRRLLLRLWLDNPHAMRCQHLFIGQRVFLYAMPLPLHISGWIHQIHSLQLSPRDCGQRHVFDLGELLALHSGRFLQRRRVHVLSCFVYYTCI